MRMQKESFSLHSELCRVFETPATGEHWFGYYDKSPFDSKNKRILSLQANFSDRMPEAGDTASILVWSLDSGRCKKIGETNAFNWQQGAMLQWLGPDFSSKIIYNDLRDQNFVSVVFDLESGHEKVLPLPVYTVQNSGKQALCVNHERHFWCRRGYSYGGIENPQWKGFCPKGDGISSLNIETGENQLIIETADMMKFNPLSSMADGDNYLEHLLFSPGGEFFFFYHRWNIADGGLYGRVYTARTDGTDIRLLYDSGNMSHYAWQDDGHLLVFGQPESRVNSLRRSKFLTRYFLKCLLPVYHSIIAVRPSLRKKIVSNHYMLFDIMAGDCQTVAADSLQEDGHPSFHPINPDWFLTDTYPDSGGNQRLLLVQISTGSIIELGSFRANSRYVSTPWRCDLHPRWDRSGKYICIDSSHTGSRQIHVFSLCRELNQELIIPRNTAL